MEIHLIMETVDLGGYPVMGYIDKNKADAEAMRMNETRRVKRIKDLMACCDYTHMAAMKFTANEMDHFYVMLVEVDDAL